MIKFTNMIIPDNETDIDLLYYEAISKTVVSLLDSADDTALTVGIHGDWGAGKSSILKMLEAEYADKDEVLCVVFNGWLFQGFEDTKAVLIETIIEKLLARPKLPATAKHKANDLLKRVNWMKVARRMGGLAFTATTGIPTLDQLEGVLATAKGFVGKAGEFSAEDIEGFISKTEGYLKDAEPDTVPNQIHKFREEFSELLSEAKIDRLIVVVDDLDRCLPKTSIETLEAIRLFLFVPGAAFVIAADEAMIEYAVKKHFPDLPLSQGPASYAQNYLEKLIQVPFRLPPLGYVETRTYITLLMSQTKLGAGDENFLKLRGLAKEVLRRPWVDDGFSREEIAKALGAVPPEVEDALNLANQISAMLTDGARGNPRQIKRFLNAMTLRLAIAERRGIADEIKFPILAKLMLAERFDPDLYSKIARETNVDGKSSTLRDFEAKNSMPKGDKQKPRAKTVTSVKTKMPAPTEDETLGEWSKRWMRLKPELGDTDLRPYLFISRDRKVLFSAVAALPQMEMWIGKLCGDRLTVKSVIEEISRLPPAEIERIFNAVLEKVKSAKDYDKRPDGIYGLTELAKLNRTYQQSVVTLLRSLPVGKLGPWVTTGWTDVFTQPSAKSGFERLREEWAAQHENKVLKVAAGLKAKKRS